MIPATNETTAIYSTLGDDPDLGELVEMYVDEMPDRISVFQQAFSSGNYKSLQRAAHQMKGAGQSYGFKQLTDLAAIVESAVRDAKPEEEILKALEELTEMCRHVRAGQP